MLIASYPHRVRAEQNETHTEKVNQKEAHADEVAQRQFEQALAAGYSFEQAMEMGQKALEADEDEFEQHDVERSAYADQLAQERCEAFSGTHITS